MIKNTTRGSGFAKKGKLKSYKVYATNKNAKIKINKYFGGYTITSKELGNTEFTVKYKLRKAKKKRTLRIRVHVVSKKKYAKIGFKKQNKYRKRKKKKKLVWSDVAYEFAKYRQKRSGFDRHRNLQRDAREFFGDFYYTGGIKVGENLIWSTITHSPIMAVKFWKGSPRHKKNMLRKQYKCGAMYVTKSTWCAVFFENSAKKLDKWAHPANS